MPMGGRLAGAASGVREIRISYGGGGFCNGVPRQFARRRARPTRYGFTSTTANSSWTCPGHQGGRAPPAAGTTTIHP